MLKKWTGINPAETPNLTTYWATAPVTSRPGMVASTGARDSILRQALYRNLGTNAATLTVGSYFYMKSMPTNTSGIFAFLDIAGGGLGASQIDLRVTNAGQLQVTRNGTVLATSSKSLTQEAWTHIEFKATVHSSTGAYEARVNGTATGWIAAATNQNTRGASSNDYANGVQIHIPVGGLGFMYDDFYVLDTTGSVANSFVGPQRIYTLRPRSDGNASDWSGTYTDNFTAVSDFVFDGDSSVNYSSTANAIDTFALNNVPSGTVSAVQHVIMARAESGSRSIRPKTRISTTNYSGTTVNLSTSYTAVIEPVSVSPATSSAWTASEINGAEFGYELVS